MDINDYRNKYTRQEFIKEIQKGYEGEIKTHDNCPSSWNLAEHDCKWYININCSECWNNALKDIKFKDDLDNGTIDITKVKYITKEQLLNRGYLTGDILFDGYSMAIVYGDKVLHINNKCVETLNSKAFDRILPIELIETNSEIQRLLSGKLSRKISQAYLVDYFIKIEEPPKLKTVCSVKFTVNADCPKDFILEDDSEAIAVNDIVEANTGGKNYQYAKVVEINTLELSEHEINNYRTCRILSL